MQMYGNDASNDIDNLAGAPMDALVQAEVLKKDNVNTVDWIEVAWTRSKNPRIDIWIDH